MAKGFNQIVSDKLDKNNYPAWKFRMTNFLQGKGYWDYIDGENEVDPECPAENSTPEHRKALKDWTQGKSKVMYWLSMSGKNGMIGYLQSVATRVVACKSLSKLNEENTKVRKFHLKIELNTVKKGNLCINDYALKIMGIVEALGSIGVIVEDDDIVCAMLEGLGDAYSNFKYQV